MKTIFILSETFTIQQAIDNIGFGKFQVKLSILTGVAWVSICAVTGGLPDSSLYLFCTFSYALHMHAKHYFDNGQTIL